MNSFLYAIQFLTTIPIKIKETAGEKHSTAAVYFPLVGILLGLILVMLNLFLSYFISNPLVISVSVVISLIILTGGLHLDGLADTFDAFFSGKDRETLLEIMLQPHIGVMGALSLMSVILLKVSVLFALGPKVKNTALILMCVLSRWSLLLPLYLFPYARREGKAKEFFGALNFNEFVFITLLTLLFTVLIWNWKGLFIFTAVSVFTFCFGRFANKKIGGITGDILGATLEIGEAIILLFCLWLGRF